MTVINLASESTQICQWSIGPPPGGWEGGYGSFGKAGSAPYAHVITFPAAAIPKGATIVQAIPRWRSAGNYGSAGCNVNLHFTAADNPSHPAGAAAAEALSLTAAVAWNAVPAWTGGVDYTGPDIKTILQAIVDRSGWVSGNRLQLVCRDNASSVGGYRASYLAGAFDIEVTYEYSDNKLVAPVDLSAAAGLAAALILSIAPASLEAQAGFSAAGVRHGRFVEPPPLAAAAGLAAQLLAEIQIAPAPFAAVAGLSASMRADIVAAPAPLLSTAALSTANVLVFIEESSRITYECILTGDGDGLPDQLLPISSFQGRFKSGDPSFLSVVVPGADYDAAISARSNGDLLVRMVKTLPSGNVIREEICRVDLESIRIDAGGASQSVTLYGHRTVTRAAKTIVLSGASYKAVTEGLIRCRCSPNLYLRAGDTVIVDGETFVADQISMYVSVDQETMEVAELGG